MSQHLEKKRIEHKKKHYKHDISQFPTGDVKEEISHISNSDVKEFSRIGATNDITLEMYVTML